MASRVGRLETANAGPVPAFVELPADAWDHGDVALEEATAEAIAEHQARTGYRGRVLVGPPPCVSEEEWLRRATREARA